jgi:peroxiredoxin
MKLGLLSVAVALMGSVADAITIGDKIPANLELHAGFKPKTINLAEYIQGRDVILMGLPGAFTPT